MSQSSFLGNVLNSLFKPKASQPAFTAAEVKDRLRLTFPVPTMPPASIHWQHSLHLHQLANLPANALSGPVQEDKAEAYQYLNKIVSLETSSLDSYDLRNLYGLNHDLEQLLDHDCWNSMALSQPCRTVRIISIRDFNRTLESAIGNDATIELLSTAWEPDKHYANCTQGTGCKLLAALVYARRREVPVMRPVTLSQTQVNALPVQELHKHYHTLAMPDTAWTDPVFMNYLVSHKTPYVRLGLPLGQQQLQIILLPRNNPHSDTFGTGLLKAGAHELSSFLLKLSR